MEHTVSCECETCEKLFRILYLHMHSRPLEQKLKLEINIF